MKRHQITDKVLMIRPYSFRHNTETSKDNVYQQTGSTLSNEKISKKAQLEFDNFVDLLESNNIDVIQFHDNLNKNTPDSIFPNNWISTHNDGVIYLYPMFASNRRIERRSDIVTFLKNNFLVNNIIDETTLNEKNNLFLEGTGSMVLDREHNIAYASISTRTNEKLFKDWCKKMNFKSVFFQSYDNNKPIYHTNVLMSICQHVVFICLDAIKNYEEKEMLMLEFSSTNKEVINISKKQMNNFLGNVLELKNTFNQSFIVMSSSAYNVLTTEQKKIINKNSQILHSSLETIEYFGGGSARCMMAEVFLKKK